MKIELDDIAKEIIAIIKERKALTVRYDKVAEKMNMPAAGINHAEVLLEAHALKSIFQQEAEMTRIKNILAAVHQHKTCSRRQLYRYLAALDIKPAGARQSPQLYPDDTAQRVLAHLGLAQTEEPSIITMDQLRAERAKARKARRAA